MLSFVLKYQTIIFFAFIISLTIYQCRLSLRFISLSFITSFGIAILLFPVRQTFPTITPILVISVVSLILKFQLKFKGNPRLLIVLGILSVSFSYFTYLISTIITVTIFVSIFHDISILVLFVIVDALEMFSLAGLLRIQRLRNSFQYVFSSVHANLLLFVSCTVLLLYIIGSNWGRPFSPMVVCILTILCMGFQIFYYWKDSLSQAYQQKEWGRKLSAFETALAQKNNDIQKLKEQNAELAKIIHKDNKLIPAMEAAITDFLSRTSINPVANAAGDTAGTAWDLLSQLKKISAERKGILRHCHNTFSQLPNTRLSSINTTLNYLNQRALAEGIYFHTLFVVDLADLVHKDIQDTQLQTLLADLIENAILATKSSPQKQILLTIEIADNHYTINLFDSGLPFTIPILLALGTAPVTSRSRDGGSGIGMMTAFEIMSNASASLVITEYAPGSTPFTKCISIHFDQQSLYRIRSYRAGDIAACSTDQRVGIELL